MKDLPGQESGDAVSGLLEVLGSVAEPTRFLKGEVLGVQGEPAAHLYVILSGHMVLHRLNSEGEEYAVTLLGPGDLFGEGSVHPRRSWLVTARAASPGKALRLAASHLPRLASYAPQALTCLMGLMSQRIERAHSRVDLLTTSSARERVIGILRLMVESYGQNQGAVIWVPMHVTRGELADMLGLARETVSRVFAELEQAGIVRKSAGTGIWVNPGYFT